MLQRLVRVAALSLLVATSWAHAQAVDPLAVNTLWVAEQDGVMRLSSSQGELLFEIRDVQDVRTVDVDLRHRVVWAYAKRVLSSFDFNGRKLLAVSVAVSDSVQAAIAVTPSDGAVWLAVGQDLLNVSPTGQVLNIKRLAANIVGLEVDQHSGLLWIATAASVEAVDLTSGALVRSLQLPDASSVVGISPEIGTGRLWLGLKDEVRLYGVGGELIRSKVASGITAIAADLVGGAWVSASKTVSRITEAGTVLFAVSPFAGTAVVSRLAPSVDGTLWVANQNSIAHVSGTGATLQQLAFQPPVRIRDLAVNPDNLVPELSIVAPSLVVCIADPTPTVQLTFSDVGWGVAPESIAIAANGVPWAVQCSATEDHATCEGTTSLHEGQVVLSATVQDFAGNRSAVASSSFSVDTARPVISIVSPVDGAVVTQSQISIQGTVNEPAELKIGATTVLLNADGSFHSESIALQRGENFLVLTATDCAGNRGSASLKVIYRPDEDGLPPDPSTVAPSVDPSKITDFAEMTSFLFADANPIQSGVVPGSINATRIAVIRGRVLTLGGQPLVGVTVAAHGQPQYGKTLSRADGEFDFAVNGGGPVVLDYTKPGFISVQRDVATAWRDFALADDVAMIPLDTVATSVAAGASVVQVAESSRVEDERGRRMATLVVPPGTGFQLLKPDGTTQAMSSLTMRATEFTIGPLGGQAMPAALPPTTAYTYAVELSADEVIAQGAVGVQFTQPLYLYVENFLDFPVGGPVPTGYYDRANATWVPSENGRVIKVLGVAPDGSAQLDIDGTGESSPAALKTLGISDAERFAIAARYTSGQTLWRVPIAHFTPYDCNWPFFTKDLTETTTPPNPDGGDPEGGQDGEEHEDNDSPKPDEPDPHCQGGSIIECENQLLGESLPIVGTPYHLTYRAVRSAAYRWLIRLSYGNVSQTLKRIELDIDIAGRRFHQAFAPQPNQTYTFTWDGKDAYGRVLQGPQRATATLRYVYPATYASVRLVPQAFGLPPAEVTLGTFVAGEASQKNSAERYMGIWDPRGQLFGSWSIDAQHVYDSNSRTLYLGTGQRRTVGDIRWVVRTVAGKVDFLHPGHRTEGGPAINFDLDEIAAVAVGADGSVYIGANSYAIGAYVVYRVLSDGTITRFAGGGSGTADGLLARDSRLSGAFDLAISKTGVVFVLTADAIKKVTVDGRLYTVVGNLSGTTGIGLSPAGELYLSTAGESVFRDGGAVFRVSAEGRLQLIARTPLPVDVAADGAGNVYVCDNFVGWIYRLTRFGQIGPYIGTGTQYPGDGGPVSEAFLNGCYNMDVGKDGSLYFVEPHEAFTPYGNRIRRVSPGGILSTIAGGSRDPRRLRETDAEGGSAIGAPWSQLGSFALAPDGSIVAAEFFDRVYRVQSMFPGFAEAGAVLPSESGHDLYVFNARHLETRSSLTGALETRLEYDSRGLLTALVDSSGNRTSIERGADGLARAITGPFGQRTTLDYQEDRLLASIANPAGETTKLTYYPNGLLSTLETPRGKKSSFSYSSLGLLLSDDLSESGGKKLTRFVTGPGKYRVRMTSGDGHGKDYVVERSANGTVRTARNGVGNFDKQVKTLAGTLTHTGIDASTTQNFLAADPRFGLAAPLSQSFSIGVPSGLSLAGGRSRSVTLSNPDDLLSVKSIQESTFVNGKTYSSTYQAASRTFTLLSPERRQMSMVVDAVRRPLSLDLPGTLSVRFSYDERGRLESIRQGSGENERSRVLTYDERGRVLTQSDQFGHVREYTYDDADRLREIHLSGGRVVRMRYDLDGNMVALTPPGRPEHLLGHTSFGAISSYTSPGASGGPTLFEYNGDQRIRRIARPGGDVMDFSYDDAGRLSTMTTAQGAYVFERSPQTGRLSRMSAPGGEDMTFTYDGFLPIRVAWSGEISGSVKRSYTKNFSVADESVNGTAPISFSYDQDGLLTGAGDLVAFRDGAGRVRQTSLGAVTTNYLYSPFGQLTDMWVTSAAGEIFRINYGFDAGGRLSTQTETEGGSTRQLIYSYDDADRLWVVNLEGQQWLKFGYDSNGNRNSVEGPQSLSATYDDGDRLLTQGQESFSYTAVGDLESRIVGSAVVRYNYDSLGNLRRVTLADGITIDYVVDARNRRVGKKVNGTLVRGWLYGLGSRIVAELDGAGAVRARFVYGPSGAVPDYALIGGVSYRFIADQLGSVRLVVNSSTGEVAQRLEYDPFGVVILDSNPGFQPFGFAGGLYDAQTGLLKLGSRDYAPHLGRWTTPDRRLFEGGDTNLYAYVANDPVNFVDPTGEWKLPANPSGLGPEWVRDYTHKDPNGERYKNPDGDVLDFHRGRPGQPGWRGKDHWHHNKNKDHLPPDTDIPDPEQVDDPDDNGDFCEYEYSPALPEMDPNPELADAAAVSLGIGIIVGTIVEDVLSGGVGIADDPATIGAGVALVTTGLP
jgi:RHS repeat-associated protein